MALKQQQRCGFNVTWAVALSLAVLLMMNRAPSCSCIEEGSGHEAKGKPQEANKAAEAAEESKGASESWAEWAKEKISGGLGLVGEEAKEAAKKASDSAAETAKKTKEKVQGIVSGTYDA